MGQTQVRVSCSLQRVLRAIAALYAAQSLVRLHGLCSLSGPSERNVGSGSAQCAQTAKTKQAS